MIGSRWGGGVCWAVGRWARTCGATRPLASRGVFALALPGWALAGRGVVWLGAVRWCRQVAGAGGDVGVLAVGAVMLLVRGEAVGCRVRGRWCSTRCRCRARVTGSRVRWRCSWRLRVRAGRFGGRGAGAAVWWGGVCVSGAGATDVRRRPDTGFGRSLAVSRRGGARFGAPATAGVTTGPAGPRPRERGGACSCWRCGVGDPSALGCARVGAGPGRGRRWGFGGRSGGRSRCWVAVGGVEGVGRDGVLAGVAWLRLRRLRSGGVRRRGAVGVQGNRCAQGSALWPAVVGELCKGVFGEKSK